MLGSRISDVRAHGRKATSLALCVSFLALVSSTGGASAASATAARSGSLWYWKAGQVAQNMVDTGMDWRNGRFDDINRAVCWPIGPAMDGSPNYYHYFWCTITPVGKPRYSMVLHPLSGKLHSATALVGSWDALIPKTVWTWDAQSVANTLVTNGITWASGAKDTLTSDTCQAFGARSNGGYPHFYCTVVRDDAVKYAVVFTLDNPKTFHVAYVGTVAITVPPQTTAPVSQGQYDNNPAILQMILTSHWWNNQIAYGNPYPPGDAFP
jgi:hypothetical protein